MKLLAAYGSAWGPGKVHIQRIGAGFSRPLCRNYVYAKEDTGDLGDVTCKRCLKIWKGGA